MWNPTLGGLCKNYERKLFFCNACQKESFGNELLDKCIEAGISANGTEYEERYYDYWDPIMKEHQKKADAMK